LGKQLAAAAVVVEQAGPKPIAEDALCILINPALAQEQQQPHHPVGKPFFLQRFDDDERREDLENPTGANWTNTKLKESCCLFLWSNLERRMDEMKNKMFGVHKHIKRAGIQEFE